MPELHTGWGRSPASTSTVVAIDTRDESTAAVRGSTGRLLGRGLGRAYGDAGLCAGGTLLDTHRLDHVGPIAADGTVTCGAGVSTARLLTRSVPRGWFVPVTPGTRHVTVGGAVAADIHGKNHHVDSSIAAHLSRLTLIDGAGSERDLGASTDGFEATVGGLGLTGLVVDASLKLLPVETSRMLVETTRVGDLEECMRVLVDADHRWRYTVAWVDTLARGRRLGRGVVTSGEHARLDEVPRGGDPLSYRDAAALPAPPWAPAWLLSRPSMHVFNQTWFRKAPVHSVRLQSIGQFFHPLDIVDGWNRLYGRPGFLQYQLAVGDDSAWVLRHAIEHLHLHRVPSFLAVLKRFGAGRGWLSFPIPGWTLTLDIPTDVPGLGVVLDALDQTVAEAGGRIYLAKDSRAKADVVAAMYPDLDRWRAVRDELDPDRRFESDLARRLDLLGA